MYIDENQQEDMIKIMQEYIEITEGGNIISRRSDYLMNIFFKKYIDNIINGIIFSKRYNFWQYAELDDLIQEARIAIINSIHKQQWKREKGSIFNFFSTVVARNLMNFTTKHNKNYSIIINIDITEMFNLHYNQNYDKNFIIDDLHKILLEYFSGKKKFEELTNLLIEYYKMNLGKKFIKKHFIDFAKMYNYSPAIINTFFDLIKRLSNKKEIKELLLQKYNEIIDVE